VNVLVNFAAAERRARHFHFPRLQNRRL